jgi:large subunit ribosomal protein L4
MVHGALRSILSDKLASDHLIVVDDFRLENSKTKNIFAVLQKNFKVKKAMIVDEENRNLELASRNIAGVKFVRATGVNAYDLVRHEWLMISKNSVASLTKWLAGRG